MREKVEREGVRKGDGGSHPRGYVHRLDQVATSFFFTNSPEEVKEEDLWKRFARYGRVGEVYIPKKVDKQGRRFGFVKYRDVKDSTEAVDLLRSISDIWFGSFKLRVNRSRFQKNSHNELKQTQVISKRSIVSGEGVVGNSYKGALVGTSKAAISEIPVPVVVSTPKQQIVWEVEVEEEVLAKLGEAYVGYLTEDREAGTLQNQLRMDGFHNLKVCSLGFAKIVLWSDKAGEVKELVETVGWWCSLFERLVPWSPLLTSNNRAIWIRCFGIPLHAWGTDLFRALAFKFGRFIEVDVSSKNMVRCDFARIRILTSEKRIIDSSLSVKVKGCLYEIRIVEETGGWSEGIGGLSGNEGEGGEVSSKASSDGGISVEAVVEGLSESGSDADVSESSCQLVQDVEKCDERGKGLMEDLGDERYKVVCVSDSFPNRLGTNGDLAVNPDGDKCVEPTIVESAESEGLVGKGTVGPHAVPILTIVEVGPKGDGSDEGVNAGAVSIVNGPAQLDDDESQFITGSEGGYEEGCEEEEDYGIGPLVLRTRNGDLPINGPPFSCPSFFAALEEIEDDDVENSDSIEPFEEHDTEGDVRKNNQKITTHCSTGENRKSNAKLNLPHLPYNMLRKLPGGLKEVKKRKHKNKRRREIQPVPENFVAAEFDLEVVLPFHSENGLQQVNRGSTSGVAHLVEGGGFLEDENQTANNEGRPLSREVAEAKKLIAINEELGVKFNDGEGEDLVRMMGLETRDKAEKNGWVQSRGYQ
ncbi:zinc finger CCCH domain-containing protein [Trifolium repens]|nr:zinc finger CCCH domain-containing protein [Trifolium repens]